MRVLTVARVLGVQRYIFRTNRLRDAVAASQKIDWATDDAVREVLRLEHFRDKEILILRSAGGEAVLVFPSHAYARKFARRYSRKLYDECPGLEYIIEHEPIQPGEFARAMLDIGRRLEKAKRERRADVRQLGISVTETCPLSNLPAVAFEARSGGTPVSAEILSLQAVGGSRRWERYLDHMSFPAAFPLELDDLGRTRDDISRIGVVHVDGNSVGDAIFRWLRRCMDEGVPDDEVMQQYKELSEGISRTAGHAFRAVLNRVIDSIDDKTFVVRGKVADLEFELSREVGGDARINLPLRPIVLAGDEMTFVCDGRIALSLATAALEAFSQQEIPHLQSVTACAGVAIVPARAPFYRSYELAEALCANAKLERRRSDSSGAWLDWHIGLPRPGASLAELREESYVGRDAVGDRWTLTCRPYPLHDADSPDKLTWRELDKNVLGTDVPALRSIEWTRHRNKLKELAELVFRGPSGVVQGRRAWTRAASQRLPRLIANDGFLGDGTTPLLDAIELLELHLPLGEGVEQDEA